MKKDIFNSIMALSFIFIALISSAYLNEIKSNVDEEAKKERTKEFSKYYVNESKDYAFNIPLIVIDTNGKSISDEEKTIAQIQVYDNKGNLNYLTDNPSLTSKVNIKIRGNTTRYYPKKQYGLELINNNGDKKDKEMLGMEKESEWILNGPFVDKSLMRNYIVFKTSREIMEYAPDAKFCEVFVIDDGSNTLEKKHYKGVYLMIEKIKRDENRVDIVKSQDNSNETSFILAKDKNREDDITIMNYGKETHIYGYGLNIEYPKKDLTKEKYEYISKVVSEFERVLYSDKFNDPLVGYSKYIDVDLFVDYYIINEFFKNIDAGVLSTYIYKDYNEKIKAGPVWDFNRSLGNHELSKRDIFDPAEFNMNQRSWFDRLLEDINFSNKVVYRYRELRKTYLSDEYLTEMVNDTVKYLGDAVNRNFETWPIYICNQPELIRNKYELIKNYENNPLELDKFLKENRHLLKDTKGRANSYDEEIEKMKRFIVERGKWLDENIDSLSKWAS